MGRPEGTTDDLGRPRGDTARLESPRHGAETDDVLLRRDATRRSAPARGETDELTPGAFDRGDTDAPSAPRGETDDLPPRPLRAETDELSSPTSAETDVLGSPAGSPRGASGGAARAPRPSARASVGPYEVLGSIGAGGMGVVYRARDASGRDVALKLVKLSDASRQERFRREAELLARFNHPGILRVHGFGEHEGQAWIATELLEGARPLSAAFRERTLAERVGLIADVADALGVVHAAGVVHRDVKPENLLLTRDGRVRVTDFGISLAEDQERLTKTGQLVGTAHYLSPEQAEGQRAIGPPTDVWALGVILYEAMTGRLPFEEASLIELFGRITSASFSPPRSVSADLPRSLEKICLRALELRPEDRFADGAELAGALRAWLAGDEPAARSSGVWLAAGAGFAAALLGLLSYAASSRPERDPRPDASSAAASPRAEVTPTPTRPDARPVVSPELLRDGLPRELVREAQRLEALGEVVAAGRCYAAAAKKRPRSPFHGDWISGAALGDPDCVAACVRELEGECRLRSRIVSTLEQAAEAKHPAAVEGMGYLLCTLESGVDVDFARGLGLLARVETPVALELRGRLGRLGCGGLTLEAAEDLLRRAAEGGSARAHRELALSALSKPLGEIDEELVLKHLRQAARGDDPLATLWLEGKRRTKRPPPVLGDPARAGHSLACTRLGSLYREGKAVPKSLLDAHAWYRRSGAAPEPLSMACLDLARLHADLEDPAGCLTWARRALAAGGPEEFESRVLDVALAPLRNLLKGDDPHLEDSLQGMLERGRALRSPRTAYALATIHDFGPRRDEQAAVAAFKWGAEAGQPDCMVYLAECLRAGRGVERDFAEAYRWAELATRQNERRGFAFLVFATYRGEGVPADPKKALRLARQHVRERPSGSSRFVLGRVLVASEDMAEREEGITWLKRSNTGAARVVLGRLRGIGARARLPLGVEGE